MDYYNEFKKFSESVIDQNVVNPSTAPTTNQRKSEFIRELKTIKNNINNILLNQATLYLEKAQNDKYSKLNELEKKMDFLIIDILRKYEDDQKDKSDLF